MLYEMILYMGKGHDQGYFYQKTRKKEKSRYPD